MIAARLILTIALASISLAAGTAAAQTLADYWPNQDGNRWHYAIEWSQGTDGATGSGELRFDGFETMSPGVETQRLLSQVFLDGPPATAQSISDPLLRRLAKWRPELRSQIEMRAARSIGRIHDWPFLFLGPLEGLATDVGYRQTSSQIGGWREPIGNWSWLYLEDNLDAGDFFQLQLIPDLVSDLYLDGTIRDTEFTVHTPAGSFNNALVVDYSITPQRVEFTGDTGEVIGSWAFHQHGWVAFVPGIGPVAMEEFVDLEDVDCPSCSPQQLAPFSGSMALTETPLRAGDSSWGAVKAQF